MPQTNLYEELRDLLAEFKEFLDENVATIKPAVNALAALVPQINDLINQLVTLMNDLKTEIQNLDVSGIPGIGEVSEFTSKVKALLEASRGILNENDTIDEILRTADVVTSLPTLDQVKGEILTLIDGIVVHLNSLKA